MNIKAKGYLLGALGAASYGTNPIFAIPLYNDGMDSTSVLFFRYVVALPIVALMLWYRGRGISLKRHEILPTIGYGWLMALSSLFLFVSYNYMSGGIASTLLFVYPIMVALLMAMFYHERAGLKTVICIVMAITGIAMLYKTSDGTTLSTMGVMMVMLSALSYAFYIIGVNHSCMKDVPSLTVTFYVLVMGIITFAAMALCNGNGITVPTHWYGWLNILGLAFFPTTLSFICTTAAILYIGSTPTAILGALEPVTAVVLGVFILSEPITARMAVGITLILIAVSIIVAGGSITSPLLRIRKMFPRLRKW